jgi:hypothetical protein
MDRTGEGPTVDGGSDSPFLGLTSRQPSTENRSELTQPAGASCGSRACFAGVRPKCIRPEWAMGACPVGALCAVDCVKMAQGIHK